MIEPGVQRPAGTFRADLFAGLAVGLLLVPQAMAYAQLAGLPPAMGLWCAAIAGPVGALLGRCQQLNAGPVAMSAVVATGALAPFAVPGTPAWVGLAALLCLLVGGIRILLALVRGSVIADLISHPVLAGFSIAAALVIPATQLPQMLGTTAPADQPLFLGTILQLIHPAGWHLPTLGMGFGSVAALVALRRWAPRLPGMLLVIIAATICSWATNYDGLVVGSLPLGLPGLVVPTLDAQMAFHLLPGAALVVLIGLAEVVTVTRSAAAITRQDVDTDRELLGQGGAALATACIAPVIPSASLSRSMLTLREGGKTRLSAAISGIVALVAALGCGPLLAHLPLAALAAGVIIALLPLIDPTPLWRAWRVGWSDGLAGTVTLVATLILAPHLVEGLLIGVGLCLLLFLHKLMRPRVATLGMHADGTWRDAEQHGLMVPPMAAVLRPDGRLSFANASAVEDALLAALTQRPGIRSLIVACEGINEIDATGAAMLLRMHERLTSAGVELHLTGLKYGPEQVLDRTGALAAFGIGRIHRSIEAALTAP